MEIGRLQWIDRVFGWIVERGEKMNRFTKKNHDSKIYFIHRNFQTK